MEDTKWNKEDAHNVNLVQVPSWVNQCKLPGTDAVARAWQEPLCWLGCWPPGFQGLFQSLLSAGA